MPKYTGMLLTGLPYHVVQRGLKNEPCFIQADDYQFYLSLWETVSARYGVTVHAYCLMMNYVHFLVTPETDLAIANTNQVVNKRYTQYFNYKYARRGRVWEENYRSSLVQSRTYLLVCMRYIEQNPVHTGNVEHPDAYAWSSYGVNAWGGESWLVPHAEYSRLGSTDTECRDVYRELSKHPLSEVELYLVRKAVSDCQPTGNYRFKQFIDEKYGLIPGQIPSGRAATQLSKRQGI